MRRVHLRCVHERLVTSPCQTV